MPKLKVRVYTKIIDPYLIGLFAIGASGLIYAEYKNYINNKRMQKFIDDNKKPDLISVFGKRRYRKSLKRKSH